MNVLTAAFARDIVLDQEAFETAAQGFAELSGKLQALRTEVETMVSTVQAGFQTPAGEKFVRACRDSLFRPLDDQKLVLDHISESLRQAREQYDSVFQSYEDLQTAIRNAGG